MTNERQTNLFGSAEPPASDYSSEFLEFWTVFPKLRKVAKRKAWEAWKRAVKRASPEMIIRGAKEYADSDLGRSKFACGPEPWLNGDRWDDDREAWGSRTLETNGKRGIDGMLPVPKHKAGEGF
jgi:hypothetical protein